LLLPNEGAGWGEPPRLGTSALLLQLLCTCCCCCCLGLRWLPDECCLLLAPPPLPTAAAETYAGTWGAERLPGGEPVLGRTWLLQWGAPLPRKLKGVACFSGAEMERKRRKHASKLAIMAEMWEAVAGLHWGVVPPPCCCCCCCCCLLLLSNRLRSSAILSAISLALPCKRLLCSCASDRLVRSSAASTSAN